MSVSQTYQTRRAELLHYFDRTAADAWAKLTSDAPVSGIRATVRAGRDETRATLLSWLPDHMSGLSLLDAGCGTGALSVEAAKRGADVTAVDLSPTLVQLAQDRLPTDLKGRIHFRSGDMLAEALGQFDHAVLMDSLIHYRMEDLVTALEGLAGRVRRSIVFTFAPRTPALSLMHFVGKAFPRSNRAPAIVPMGEAALRHRLSQAEGLGNWSIGRSHRVSNGFYISHSLELVRS